MNIDIDLIVVDETIYPRTGVDPVTVGRLFDALEIGTGLPPIVLEARTHRLVDGRHRYEAHQRKGLRTIGAMTKSYLDEAELFADAVRLNTGHGRSLTGYDVRRAVARLIEAGWQIERISDAVRVPAARIDEIRRGFAHSVDGNPVPLKRGLAHERGHVLAELQIGAVRRYGGSQGTFYANQLISLIENDLFPSSPGFREAMDNLADLWRVAREGRPAA